MTHRSSDPNRRPGIFPPPSQRPYAVNYRLGPWQREPNELIKTWGIPGRQRHELIKTCGIGRAGGGPAGGLLQVVAQLLRARGVAQLAQRLRLDLADAL